MAFWNWVPSQLKNPGDVPLPVLPPEGAAPPGPPAGDWLGWK
jgi:hypothetical protein